jgi:hypothetical protein
MVDLCVSSGRPGFVADLIALGNTSGLDERLERAIGSNRLTIGRRLTAPFGSAIILYTGPGVAGLAWRWRDPRVSPDQGVA